MTDETPKEKSPESEDPRLQMLAMVKWIDLALLTLHTLSQDDPQTHQACQLLLLCRLLLVLGLRGSNPSQPSLTERTSGGGSGAAFIAPRIVIQNAAGLDRTAEDRFCLRVVRVGQQALGRIKRTIRRTSNRERQPNRVLLISQLHSPINSRQSIGVQEKRSIHKQWDWR